MYNIIALILTTLFIPLISLLGIKYFNIQNHKKTFVFFTLCLLGCELVRFFYNASLYEKAVTPASELTFSFITVTCIVSLFATFLKDGKFADLTKTICVFTCLIPLVFALFSENVYTNELDTFAVTKALYFIECGLSVTLAIVYAKYANIKLSALNMLWSVIFGIAYALIDLFINFIWETNVQINLMWGLTMICSVITVVVIYLVDLIILKIKSKKQNLENNG